MTDTPIVWTIDSYHRILIDNGIECSIKDVPKCAPDNWLTIVDADNEDGFIIVKVNECEVNE